MSCYVRDVWYEGAAQLLSLTEFKCSDIEKGGGKRVEGEAEGGGG